ncbi:DNA mismatch repair endonuclease MutL [Candidatus Woesearchaeota archaeon]|nr:DNA mismatch repair endonuclease MutL [Candidatus Woesearchaeota archaeon]
MGSIQILPNEIINKIAAGEVIERPASVVKELLENSLDAQATQITVEVKEGGKVSIKVTDNGTGMSKEDAILAIERHATSKIKTIHDLFAITTLGFRGEALASIGAVSLMKIQTKQDRELVGTQVQVEGDGIVGVNEVGCPSGTSIEVKDLFYNTPARRKYLKSTEIEFSHIADVVTRYALANPGIFYKLLHNDNEIFISPATNDMLSNIVSIYGKDVAKDLLAIHFSGDIDVMGYISKPQLTRKDKSQQSLFINKRYVKNSIVSNAVHDAYHTLLFAHRYPIVVLYITIDPTTIDVNVHPQKTEIRVEHESSLYAAVFRAVRNTLQENNLWYTAEGGIQQSTLTVQKPQIHHSGKKRYPLEHTAQTLLPSEEKRRIKEETAPQLPDQLPAPDTEIIVLGQIGKTYLIIEDAQGLQIVDQHAAHERVYYEQFMDTQKEITVQQLVQPKIITVPPHETAIVEQYKDLLQTMGFALEPFGMNTYKLASVPFILGKIPPETIIHDLLDSLQANRNIKDIEELRQKMVATMACRAAIKAGDTLTPPQSKMLVTELFQCRMPYTCPHGRPTVISFTIDTLEKMFKRK